MAILCNFVPVEVPHLAPHWVVHTHDAAAPATVVVDDAVFAKPISPRRRRRPLDPNQGILMEVNYYEYIIVGDNFKILIIKLPW